MRTATLLLALALVLGAGATLLPPATAGPVCTTLAGSCAGFVCAPGPEGRVCVGEGNQCDPAPCPPPI